MTSLTIQRVGNIALAPEPEQNSNLCRCIISDLFKNVTNELAGEYESKNVFKLVISNKKGCPPHDGNE